MLRALRQGMGERRPKPERSGKARVSVDMEATVGPLEGLLGAVLINPDGQPSHHVVIEGLVVDPPNADDRPTHVPPPVDD